MWARIQRSSQENIPCSLSSLERGVTRVIAASACSLAGDTSHVPRVLATSCCPLAGDTSHVTYVIQASVCPNTGEGSDGLCIPWRLCTPRLCTFGGGQQQRQQQDTPGYTPRKAGSRCVIPVRH